MFSTANSRKGNFNNLISVLTSYYIIDFSLRTQNDFRDLIGVIYFILIYAACLLNLEILSNSILSPYCFDWRGVASGQMLSFRIRSSRSSGECALLIGIQAGSCMSLRQAYYDQFWRIHEQAQTPSCSGPIPAQKLRANSVPRAVFSNLMPKMDFYYFHRFS